ncbi:hypothetical protein TPHA_0L01430 [Tetrapisispora phaffii CBS 4417]|uniref:Inner centromere protein ARK-binding domain-containing protein n=1 Tax=Tetrapisispora phaffii (strain ATCC 24235 / CBS 4417 / NBRC 1672 / NRRL Y-8282 / UCD 70-5) TaxID=1071381 RepID=G8C020_TETPH|nr:hypothetical protein TPHA_0L01430 [Tetrapisispora phaffii CBS 4417]CCE65498.1 hypothetical protein TPHA_0L01430 [Tetrapisispora phaffii CBS 4417]
MDWAIKAAKKKTQVLPGSTRSIIESLNALNNVIITDQNSINAVISKEKEWLNSNFGILSSSFDNSKLSISLISPEKTVSIEDNKKVTDISNAEESLSDVLRYKDSDAENVRNGEYVPSIRYAPLPKQYNSEQHITPESTNTVNIVGIQNSNKTDNTGTTTLSSYEVPKERSSPWSPYKVDKLLNGPLSNSRVMDQSSTSSNIVNKTASVDLKTSADISETHQKSLSAVSNTSTSVNVTRSKPLENKRKQDLAKRRSNMFVPLPDKDPLVVQPFSSNATNTNIQSFKEVSDNKPRRSLLIPINTHENFNDSKFVKQSKHIPQLSTSSKNNKNNHNNPGIRKSPSISSNISKSKGSTPSKNVFDRLSKLPTKSFENKILPKSNRPFSSAIDLKGSPIRRTSFRPKKRETIDETMEQALKNIFSTKEEFSMPGAKFKDDNTRRSLIPKYNRYESTTKLSNSAMKSIDHKHEILKRTQQISPLRSTNISKKLTKNPSPPSIPRKTIGRMSMSSKNISISPLRSRLHANSPSPLKNKIAIGRMSTNPPLPHKNDNPSNHEQNRNKLEVVKKNDRLTGFKLLSSIESNNNVISNGLSNGSNSKRLSYMKDSKLQNKYEESKQLATQSIKHKAQKIPNLATGQQRNDNENYVSDNILHDLHTKDYRNKIGAISKYSPTQSTNNADQSLPEIFSDSDSEDNKVLAPWAESPRLQEQLKIQETWNTSQLFGSFPPLYMDEIFHNSRLNKFKTGQSLSYKNK